jgi:hypothetical protein
MVAFDYFWLLRPVKTCCFVSYTIFAKRGELLNLLQELNSGFLKS